MSVIAAILDIDRIPPAGTSAVNLKFLSALRQVHHRNFKFKTALESLVVLRFRSSHQRLLLAVANFGIGPPAAIEDASLGLDAAFLHHAAPLDRLLLQEGAEL